MKILLFTLIILLTGCTGNFVNSIRDDNFTVGCVAITEQLNIGYFNQAGGLEACKLKCSEKLPEGYTFEYADPRVGCKATIGIKDGR